MFSCVGDKSSTCRVSPFGYSWINACLRLPMTFRSLPRPSSALGALASTLCSSSLDYSPETPLQSFRSIDFLFCNWSFKTFLVFSLCSCQGARRLSPPFRTLFRILKTIQMNGRQFLLGHRPYDLCPSFVSAFLSVRFDCLFYASFPPRNRPRFETSAFALVCSLERR